MKIPEHVAIILDGNGRWARSHHMPRNFGHAKGSENVENIIRACGDLGIKYLTVYAFSTENWSRPAAEVNALMALLRTYLKKCIRTAVKDDLKVRVIGDVKGLAPDIQQLIRELEDISANCSKVYFTMAINYGSRDEMVRGMRRMAEDLVSGELKPEDITEDRFETYLDTCGLPDPDLMIRTSGELRLSNYMMWQMAYTEFYFTDVAWPDFDKNELIKACEAYSSRDRRFGSVANEEE